jgi:hypothetical protein
VGYKYDASVEETSMKKIILLVVTLPVLFYCKSSKDEVERVMEGGVEVVVNHLEPYKIKGKLCELMTFRDE